MAPFLCPERSDAMFPVSSAFLQAVQENTRNYYWTGKITIKNGVVYDFGPDATEFQ